MPGGDRDRCTRRGCEHRSTRRYSCNSAHASSYTIDVRAHQHLIDGCGPWAVWLIKCYENNQR